VTRTVADGGGGIIIATAQVDVPPKRILRAFSTDEVERWWGHADYYRMTHWEADLRVCGQCSVTVRFSDGSGEIAECDAPHKLVMTRRFEKHPLLGTRETTSIYRFEPIAMGTRITVREKGFLGRSEAAYANAERWERVLGCLDRYLKRDGSAYLWVGRPRRERPARPGFGSRAHTAFRAPSSCKYRGGSQLPWEPNYRSNVDISR